MKKIKIKIVLIGISSVIVDCKYLSKWNSILFKIDNEPLSLSNLSDIEFDGLNLSNEIIKDLFDRRVNSNNSDILVGITDRQLDKKWFTQRISEKSFVISFCEFEEKLMLSNIPIENFVLRFIYPFCLIYLNNQNKIPEQENSLIHKDTQSCIFDFMKYKNDVMGTLIKPTISSYSKSKFTIALPDNFLVNIEKELQRLNIKLFYRIKKWIKQKPILTIFISGLFALIINLIAVVIYKLIST